MDHFKYSGYIKLVSGQSLPEWCTLAGKGMQSAHLSENLSVTNRELLKYENEKYILLLDGGIYEFDYQVFSEDQFPHLVDHLSRDPEDALRRLNGEFVLIFVELRTETIWVFTSESGNAAFFYNKSKEGIQFSNSLSEIAGCLVDNKQIFFQRIYDILAGNRLGSHHTCYTAIKRLKPGYYLKVFAGKVLIDQYSKLFSFLPERESIVDPYEKFREHFAKAVGRRIDATKLGIALSSGKDSTSVAAMASMVRTRPEQDITGYTYFPSLLKEEYLSNIRYNETLLLDGFFKSFPEVNSKHVVPETESIIKSLEESIEIYGEPVYGASNQFWIREMQEMMKRDQVEIMLTGQGGNYTISWPPPELSSPGPGPFRSLIRKFNPALMRGNRLPYLSRDFLNSVQQEHFINSKKMRFKDQIQALLLENSIAYTGYLQKQVSLHYGFHVSDPTLDKNIIEYCLSLPYEVYHNQHGSRRLVTYGLKDLLPEEIRENQIRSVQAADIQNRIQLEKELILEKLQFLNNNNLVTFVIDVGGLKRDLELMDFSTMSRKKFNRLVRLIQVGIFLSKI